MENIKTELGKIYCSYNEEKDKFDKYRVTDISYMEEGNKDSVQLEVANLDDNYHEAYPYKARSFGKKEYEEFAHDHVLLKSEGIISLTNAISLKAGKGHLDIRDIILMYFPNNKNTKVPNINEPFAVARQAVDNIFAAMAGQLDYAGLSVTTETVPAGYALSDFIDAQEAISSRLCHVYKTDRPDDIDILLNSSVTDDILNDLYIHRVSYLKNVNPDADLYIKNNEKCLDGYCKTLKDFIIESGFFEDITLRMGIRIIDFKLEENKPIEDKDKLVLSVLYGGISICKAVPMKFDYEVNLSVIKMPYLLLLDTNEDLYIVPYTKNPDEFDGKAFYDSMVENDDDLQKRLQKVVKAYDIHKNDEPELKF